MPFLFLGFFGGAAHIFNRVIVCGFFSGESPLMRCVIPPFPRRFFPFLPSPVRFDGFQRVLIVGVCGMYVLSGLVFLVASRYMPDLDAATVRGSEVRGKSGTLSIGFVNVPGPTRHYPIRSDTIRSDPIRSDPIRHDPKRPEP